MPRGGYRPGGGRPKGSLGKAKRDAQIGLKQAIANAPTVQASPSSDEQVTTPLAFMLQIMNDPNADPVIRARMAIAAAPFMHTRIAEGGKKEEKAKAAKDASKGKFAPAAPPKLVVNNR